MAVCMKFSKTAFPPLALLFRPLSSLSSRSSGDGELKDPLGIPSGDCKGQVCGRRGWAVVSGGRVAGPGVEEPHQLLQSPGGHLFQLQNVAPPRLSQVQGLCRWSGEGRGPAGEGGAARDGPGFSGS